MLVEVATKMGFDPTLAPGMDGALLSFDPRDAHMIGDFCNFIPGVQCDGTTAHGPHSAYALYWSNMGLTGTISHDLNKLKNLRRIYLHGNQFHGNIPDLALGNLEELFLSNNSLSGAFPDLQLPSLWKLYLSDNNLTGVLPGGLGEQLPQLRRFSVGGNKFHGHIPPDLAFFNNSNADVRQSSIECDFSGNNWDCPIAQYIKAGPSYDCEAYAGPIDCIGDEELAV